MTRDPHEHELAPAKAFVVHLLAPGPQPAAVAGRVEHVMSGDSSYFTSLDELGRFMCQVVERHAGTDDPLPASDRDC